MQGKPINAYSGGPLQFDLTNEAEKRKLKKRMQLQSLLATKFRNKYCLSLEDETWTVIQNELNELFKLETFDERDLLKVDQKIRESIQEREDKEKAKKDDCGETDAITEVNL